MKDEQDHDPGQPPTVREKCSYTEFFCPYFPAFGLYLSIFSLNARKYRPEKLRIRTFFTQCHSVQKLPFASILFAKMY